MQKSVFSAHKRKTATSVVVDGQLYVATPSTHKADKYNRPTYLVAIDEAVKNCHAKSFGFDLSRFMERNCDDNPAMELDNREGAIAWSNVMEGGR